MRCYVLGIITTIFLLAVSCTQDLPEVPKFEVQQYCKLNDGKCIKINSSEEETFCSKMAGGKVINGICEEEQLSSSSDISSSSSSGLDALDGSSSSVISGSSSSITSGSSSSVLSSGSSSSVTSGGSSSSTQSSSSS
jgi:hypothetical protein